MSQNPTYAQLKLMLDQERNRRIHAEEQLARKQDEGFKSECESPVESQLQKRIDQALRDSHNRLQTIMETCADAIVVYDADGSVTYLNPAFTELFGWTAEELMGKRIDFVPSSAMDETRKAVLKVINGERLTGFESRRRTRTGKTIDVRIGAAPFLNDDGTLGGMVVNFSDITEHKRMLGELILAKKKAEDASRVKSEFLANMSHEIRTPMNGVIGMTELLIGTGLDPEQLEFANTIRTSGDALLSLINDILDFSKIEAGKLSLEVLSFDLAVTLDTVGDMVAVRAHEKGLEYVTRIEQDVPIHLKGDPGRLRQILVNLAGNAVKFTETGEILVSAAVEEYRGDCVKIRFSVTDTGIGIPEEKLGCLFDSFSQVDSSTTRKYGGTGLGLTISRNLAQMMGGDIGVSSEEGRGSLFWFTAEFVRQENVPKPKSSNFDLADTTVLIVDDNKTNRAVMKAQLTVWGCLTDQAASGPEALQKLEMAATSGTPYDVAVLDMQMPEMDGKTLGMRIKADPLIRQTPLIMMTSMGERGDAKMFEQIGFAAYLSKPVKMTKLRACLARVCDTETGDIKNEPGRIITQYSLAEANGQQHHILLAEDNRINQKVAVKTLSKMGYTADVAANGLEALTALKTGKYDLVLMDCQMPEMDGYEAVRQIREACAGVQNTKIPVIAMTAHAIDGAKQECLRAGMDDYISKPVKPNILAAILEKWLGKASGQG